MNNHIHCFSRWSLACALMVVAACVGRVFARQQEPLGLRDRPIGSASFVADQAPAEKEQPSSEDAHSQQPDKQPHKQFDKQTDKQTDKETQPEKQQSADKQPPDKESADQQKPDDDKALQEEIKRLVEQLSAERFSERQEASRRLAEIGRPAIPALTERALGDSLEGIIRSINILRGLYSSNDETVRQEAKQALEKIAKSDNPSAASRANEALKAAAKPVVQPKPQPKPVPQPPQEPATPKGDAQRVQTARLALQHWAELLPRLTGNDDLKGASKESLDQLRQAVDALRRELAELEKRLEAAGQPVQPEAAEKSAEQKSLPAEPPIEKPQQQ